ncbi:MAG: putative esterase [halophilic archaeon J07HX5]|nr:MAG: putative esterase [halophilic archaeon J07HX5]
MPSSGPHQGQPTRTAGAPLETADAVVVLVHGRGATAESILDLADELGHEAVAYRAPQAAARTWYPNSFLASVTANEPGRSSGLERIDNLVAGATAAGVPTERIIVAGFSQGACLASEYVTRHPRRYGGLAALSGGLIGASVDKAAYQGDLAGTPALLGCSTDDPHIPAARVHETAAVLEELGATVDTRLYEELGHAVNDDELTAVKQLIDTAVERTEQ